MIRTMVLALPGFPCPSPNTRQAPSDGSGWLIQRKFRLDGLPPAPPASTASPPLRRSPPCRPGEPGLAPPARRLQEDGDSAEGAQERPPLLRALDQAFRPAQRGPPTRQC